MPDNALAPNLESVTFKMDVRKPAKGNYLQFVAPLVLEQYSRPSASKRLGNLSHNFVQQPLQIQYRVYFLCGLLKQQQLADAPFESLVGRCRSAHSGNCYTVSQIAAIEIALTHSSQSEWVKNVIAAGGVVRDPTRQRFPIPVRVVLRIVGADEYMELQSFDLIDVALR
jgi:hypothetical protein